MGNNNLIPVQLLDKAERTIPGVRSAPVPRRAPLGAPTSINLSDLIIQVLADLLQCLVYALEVIVSEAPAAALLGVRVLVAEDCPPCNDLAVLVLETIAVNAHAAALAHLVVIHCVLSPAYAA